MRHTIGHVKSEAEFAHELDVELMEKRRGSEHKEPFAANVRDAAELAEERLRLAEATGIRDEEILRDLQNVGYNPATASLLFLAPLIQVAWVDGAVARSERNRVLAIAEKHGVRGDAPGVHQLALWLDRRPRDKFLHESWRAICARLDSLPPGDRAVESSSLMQECRSVAAASGGFLNRICAAERRLLESMERDLKPHPESAAPAANAAR